MKILVMNGPNLNMLGIREPDIYGQKSYQDLIHFIQGAAAALDVDVDFYQSNHEGDLVDAIQEAYGVYDGIVINPGAYTHTSVALLDAVKAVAIPTVEVHISHVDEREAFRQVSYIRRAALATITGMGFQGYVEGIKVLIGRSSAPAGAEENPSDVRGGSMDLIPFAVIQKELQPDYDPPAPPAMDVIPFHAIQQELQPGYSRAEEPVAVPKEPAEDPTALQYLFAVQPGRTYQVMIEELDPEYLFTVQPPLTDHVFIREPREPRQLEYLFTAQPASPWLIRGFAEEEENQGPEIDDADILALFGK